MSPPFLSSRFRSIAARGLDYASRAAVVREAIFYEVIPTAETVASAPRQNGQFEAVLSDDSKTPDRAVSDKKKRKKGYSMAAALLDCARFRVGGMDRCKSQRTRVCRCARAYTHVHVYGADMGVCVAIMALA